MTLNFKIMKKLELTQMENLQGGSEAPGWKCFASSFVTGFGIGSLQPEIFAAGFYGVITYC